jgi:hypothetical protein
LCAIQLKQGQPWQPGIGWLPPAGFWQARRWKGRELDGKPQHCRQLAGRRQDTTATHLDKPANGLRSSRQQHPAFHAQRHLVITYKESTIGNQSYCKVALSGARRPEDEDPGTGKINARCVYKHVRQSRR